MADSM
jgi:hypothetical protein